MGTRSNTVVIETGGGKEFVLLNMYRQFDGYLSGHGKELYAFLFPLVMCNGLPSGDKEVKFANGAGCLAAQLVAHFKTGAGGIYIDKPTLKACIGVHDYTYVIRVNTYEPTEIDLQVLEYGHEIYRGGVAGLEQLIAAEAIA